MAARVERGLLVRSVRYALTAARLVTPDHLPRPTPCAEWDLRTLLQHIGDSMDALSEGLYTGFVDPGTALGDGDGDGDDDDDGGPGPGPVAGLTLRAGTLLCASAAAGSAEYRVAIGDRELTTSLVTMTGAVEIAVHGWDISRACGSWEPIPPMLALDLLEVAPLLVAAADRYPLFAPPVPAGPTADPGDRLAAFLGREIVRPVQGGVIRCRTRQS